MESYNCNQAAEYALHIDRIRREIDTDAMLSRLPEDYYDALVATMVERQSPRTRVSQQLQLRMDYENCLDPRLEFCSAEIDGEREMNRKRRCI